MTARDIRNYRRLENLIAAKNKQLIWLLGQTVFCDSVRGSNLEYPYEERTIKIVGGDSVMSSEQHRQIVKLERDIDELERNKRLIEWLVENAEDNTDREIMILTMQGKTQGEVSAVLRIDQSTVSRRIEAMIKNIMVTD